MIEAQSRSGAGRVARADRHGVAARGCVVAVAVTVLAAVGLLLPGTASAHGPVAPLASSDLARVSSAPSSVHAVVVDGDQRLWLRLAPGHRLTVEDPLGAPYLRFDAAGVSVNENSELFYLNQTPIAAVPPRGLSRRTPPRWSRVADGPTYEWHDGRLHALAVLARTPGTSVVGRWSIPLVLDGSRSSITGVLDHADAPSPVWFWPALVAVLCLLAARRLRRPALDRSLARAVSEVTLLAIGVAAAARYLHGRPAVDPFSVIEFGVTVALAGWAGVAAARGRLGFLGDFAIGFVALWEAITLLTTLTHGYVLAGVPSFLARAATVACLGGGVCLLLLAFRIAEERPRRAGGDVGQAAARSTVASSASTAARSSRN